jgi:four helix bundle protein
MNKTYKFGFEKLEVWQMARKLSIEVYKATKSFPSEEKYTLVSQIRRAAVSVASNIAEGSSRRSAKDQSHFTTMSFSSLMELISHLIIATDLEYLTEDVLDNFRASIQTLSVKLSNLKNAQEKRIVNR